MKPRHSSESIPFPIAAAVLLATLGTAGCYDPAAMIARVRNDAIQSRLEEVDLGEHHVTLPRDPRSNEMTEVFLHLFGTSVHYRIGEIEQRMEEEEHLLKQQVLVAVRETTNEEFADPGLMELRKRLMDAINSVLVDTPIERIGIYNLRLIRH